MSLASDHLALGVSDEGYSRNPAYALNQISTLSLFYTIIYREAFNNLVPIIEIRDP